MCTSISGRDQGTVGTGRPQAKHLQRILFLNGSMFQLGNIQKSSAGWPLMCTCLYRCGGDLGGVKTQGGLFPLRTGSYVLQDILVCLNMTSLTGVKSEVFRNLQGLGVRGEYGESRVFFLEWNLECGEM